MSSLDCNNNRDPLALAREGTTQRDRQLTALDPTNSPVDGLSVEHHLLFTEQVSAFIDFYDTQLAITNNWQVFFSTDVSVTYARLSLLDIDAFNNQLQLLLRQLNTLDLHLQTTLLKENLGQLFSAISASYIQLDTLLTSLPTGDSLRALIKTIIEESFAPSLPLMIGTYKACISDDLIKDVSTLPPRLVSAPEAVTFAQLLTTGLSTSWTQGQAWNAFVAAQAADHTLLGLSAGIFARINHLATHKLFTRVFEQLIARLAQIKSAAKLAFDSALHHPEHEPHFGLYIAFLRLLDILRDDINSLTARHLDFYFKDILRLREKPAVTAQSHAVIELAKNVSSTEIQAGTAFDAGKDAQGQTHLWQSTTALVASQAKPTLLKRLYQYQSENKAVSAAEEAKWSERWFADKGIAPTEIGAEGWHPFATKIQKDNQLIDIPMEGARIGFAIASDHLHLAEGYRDIYLQLTLAQPISDSSIAIPLNIRLTGEKGWQTYSATLYSYDEYLTSAYIYLTLSPSEPAIIALDEKIHGSHPAKGLPVCELILPHDDSTFNYTSLCDTKVTQIDLYVSASHIRSLQLFNELGSLDNSQPFQPFGPLPKNASSVIVGCPEAFRKNISYLAVYGPYAEPPKAFVENGAAAPKLKYEKLVNGDWVSANQAATNYVSSSLYLSIENHSATPVELLSDYYSSKSTDGYLRIKLQGDPGRDAFQRAYIAKLIAKTSVDGLTQPNVPVLDNITLYYSAQTSVNLISQDANQFSQREIKFFHLAPFGCAEQHTQLTPENSESDVYLFPQFSTTQGDSIQADFYIGIEQLVPPQALSILFHVVDGTTNPLLEKPPSHIQWSYLSNNYWKPFSTNQISDSTQHLLRAGIIQFSCQADMTNTNSLLPSGYFWLRASVTQAVDAVGKLAGIFANAVAVFDPANDPMTELAANSIQAISPAQSAIKTVTQPFASFGGKPKQAIADFYTSVSERLRHKDRALSLWDYEHIVLNEFPDIYQAKCLNHTEYRATDTGGVYRELAPGHVTLVVLPRIQTKELNLTPYASARLISEIQTYLSARSSPCVRLHVTNPIYEPLQISCNIKLIDGVDESFTLSKLQSAITAYLSPWTFGQDSTPSFGRGIEKSALIRFIENQASVDYVTDLKLLQGDTLENFGSRALPSNALSILASVPATHHQITVIHSSDASASSTTCSCAS